MGDVNEPSDADWNAAVTFGEEAVRTDPTCDEYDMALAKRFAAVREEGRSESAAEIARLREAIRNLVGVLSVIVVPDSVDADPVQYIYATEICAARDKARAALEASGVGR